MTTARDKQHTGCSFICGLDDLQTRNLSRQNPLPTPEHHMQVIQKEAAAPLTVPQAAAALNRSCTWVRDRLTMGLLEKDSSSTPRRIKVTSRSVRLAQWAMPAPVEPTPARFLRLVVDNTATATK